MKIYFSPEYGSVNYWNAERDILMDVLAADLPALVAFLESRCGRYVDETAERRQTMYCAAMRRYMEQHPDNVLAASFGSSDLATAQQCLHWRDALIDAGWTVSMSAGSARLKVLAAIEQQLTDQEIGSLETLGQRVRVLIERMPKMADWLGKSVVQISVDMKLLPPLAQQLLGAMKQAGCQIKVDAPTGEQELGCGQEHVEVWEFETEKDALEYLATLDDKDFDVWINRDNRRMDAWLQVAGKPTAGSIMKQVTPQVSQLLVLGVGLFQYPLNIRTLLQWLNAPKHPLDAKYRYGLARLILTEGGYHNQKCDTYTEDYVNSIKDTKERNKFCDRLKMMLPEPSKQGVCVESLRTFCSELTQWANGQLIAARNPELDYEMDEQLMQQMQFLYNFGEAFTSYLGSVKDEWVDYGKVEKWMDAMYEPANYIHSTAQQGCRLVVNKPGALIDSPKTLIWTDFYDEEVDMLTTDFLSKVEKKELTDSGCCFWGEECEREFYRQMRLMPLKKTLEKLVLVTVNKKDNAKTEKHPLLIQLTNKYETLTIKRDLKPKAEPLTRVDNTDCMDKEKPDVFQFKHTDMLEWPDRESYSSLQNLIEYPVDYVFEYLLNISDGGKQDFERIERTMGEVAHAVIEEIFAPKQEGALNSPETIEETLKTCFDEVYDSCIEAKGAILHLLENKIAEQSFKIRLRQSLECLLELLKDNNLRVAYCEREIIEKLGFKKPAKKDLDIKGYVDLIVENNQGQKAIIDFKWTSGSTYKNNIKENKSLQLALYAEMVKKNLSTDVAFTGYFLMPEGCLYTHSNLKGKRVKQFDADGRIVFEEVKNSYSYRVEQIGRGEIELADGMAEDDIQYCKDRKSPPLLPVYFDDKHRKGSNMYSYIKTLTNGTK